MRHGLFVPPFGPLAEPSLLGDLAALTEDAGWDGFFLWDHVVYRAPVTDVTDSWIGLAAAAMRTSRVVLGPLVTPLPRRRPQIVARQVVALDRLSNGRMVLGAGLGLDSSGRELSAFGEELDDRVRAAMLDESLEVVVALMRGQEVAFAGHHYRADGVRFLPGPVQPHVPIWLAARWPNRRPLRRAVRYDGVFEIDTAGATPAEVVELVASERGGDLEGFDVVVEGYTLDEAAAWAAAGATWWLQSFDAFTLTLDGVQRVIEEGPPR